jgi:hypothetical protein
MKGFRLLTSIQPLIFSQDSYEEENRECREGTVEMERNKGNRGRREGT